LGSNENPLIIVVVSSSPTAEQIAAAQQLSNTFSQSSGKVVSVEFLPDYASLIVALRKGDVQAGWLPPVTYIYAKDQGAANVLLLANHFGVYFYGTAFFANRDTEFHSYFDQATNRSTAKADIALPQFNGKRPCLVDQTSVSGYLVPIGLLNENQVLFQPPVLIRSYTGIIRALYIKAICDFGATFAISGDPRTSTAVTTDLTDALDRVVVIWQSDPMIPNTNLSVSPTLAPEFRDLLTGMLTDIMKSPDGKTALSTVLQYDVQDLKVVDDSVYDPLREMIKQSRVNIIDWIGW
jgi:phosphonate transport system substrate-binding protein